MKIMRVLVGSIFLLVMAAVSGATTAKAQGVHLHAVLLGGNEIDGGDPNGYGTAAVQFDGDQVCVAIVVTKIKKPTAAHIHEGFAPVAGPVVVTLTAPEKGDSGGSFGCVEAAPALISEIRKNPSSFYINVHTGDFPGGAVRGQLF